MKYLIWLGIAEKDSYDIIKKIAKKKFKEAELEELEKTLLAGWKKQVGNEEGFFETWEVVKNAAKYSFNASHSLAYGYDSLYGAYLKSHYPLEYYTVVFNYYDGDSERTARLFEEIKHFGISMNPAKFRRSKSGYTMSKEDNSIYKGIGSIKNLNAEVADQMYQMRDAKYANFIDLLYDLKNQTKIKRNQIEILIKLDFFSEFGETNILLKQYELFEKLAGKKTLKKENFSELGISEGIVSNFCEKETEKQYNGLDSKGLLMELAGRIQSSPRTLKEKVKAQVEYLGLPIIG